MAEITDAQVDGQFGGGDTPPPSAGDIFDQAKVHYFEELDPVSTKELDKDKVGENDEKPDTDETADTSTEDAKTFEDDEDSKLSESEFKPYSFKGNVFDQEVEKTFESPEELNKIISRGLASETLYKRLKERDTVIQSLQADAESGREVESLAKENPEALIDLVIDKHMSEEQAASKVLELFKHYRNMASMTPEEREHQRKLKLADRLLQEKEAAERAKEEAKREEEKFRLEQQKAHDRDWANYELRRLSTKFQGLDSETIKQQILNVMNRVKLSRIEGQPMSHKQATQLLVQYMRPFEKLTSPAEAKRRLGEATAQKKKDSANSLQTAARQQMGRQAQSSNSSSGPMDSGDLFDIIKSKVAKGELKLRP